MGSRGGVTTEAKSVRLCTICRWCTTIQLYLYTEEFECRIFCRPLQFRGAFSYRSSSLPFSSVSLPLIAELPRWDSLRNRTIRSSRLHSRPPLQRLQRPQKRLPRRPTRSMSFRYWASVWLCSFL